MIVLHGKGDSLKPFSTFDQELGLQNINYLLLNAPKKFLDGFSWYGDPPYQREGVATIRSRLFSLFDELQMAGWKEEKIFLLGFSQGCLVSTDFALHFPKKLAGVIGISGYFNFEPRWRKKIQSRSVIKQTPWLLTHGYRDQIIPIEETRYGVKKLKNIGLDIEWIESKKDHIFSNQDYSDISRWIEERMS